MFNLNRDRVLKFAGAVLAAASCIPMLAVLPGGIVTVLGLIGITAASAPIVALTALLAPIAQPLLLISIGMLIAGHLRCGWPPVLLAAVGGLSIYLAMYVFVVPAPAMDSMTGMAGQTNEPLFYIGLILLLGSFVSGWWRRRKNVCRPLYPLRALQALLARRAANN